MDESVKKYIEKQKSPQKEKILKLREILLQTYPKINETFKNGVPWYEDMFYIAALKNKVHMGFSLKDLSQEEKELFEGTGKTMRHIKIFSLEEIDETQITRLIKLVREKK